MSKNNFGILVSHGTDTLAWTFSYLRYSLKNLPCNVVLAGAQIPMNALFSYSDGFANVKSSVLLLKILFLPMYVLFLIMVKKFLLPDLIR